MPDTKPAARPGRATRSRARTPRPVKPELTPLEFLKSVYRAPLPEGASIAERIKIVANQLNAAKNAAAIEIRLGAADGGGDLAALLRDLEGGTDADC